MFKFLVIMMLFMATAFASPSHDGYIVKYKDNYKSLNVSDPLSHFNMKVVKEIPKSMDNIEYIEPNYIVTIDAVPEDPKYSEQWAHRVIKSEPAWDLSVGSSEIIVAIIDTGVDYTHNDLKENVWVNEAELNGEAGVDDDGNGFVDDIHGFDFVNTDGDPMDDHNHGTHCAGIIGAKHNTIGVAGVNSNVKIMPLKFLSSSGSGSTANAIKAVFYAVNNGAKILSNSWGGGGSSQAMIEAIEYAKERGVIFVAAAGNANTNIDTNPSYPASYKIENVIAVAASDVNDNRASFSNYGETVHIAAPGKDIMSTVRNNGYASYSGTSMACPYVSGALALMMSYEELPWDVMKKRLLDTSDYLPSWEGLVMNAGRLNLNNLLTNTIPQRPIPPDDGEWRINPVSIETPHPYENNKTYTYKFYIPQGTKFLRVHFKSFDTEIKYDKVTIAAGKRKLVYDGNRGEFFTKHLVIKNEKEVTITLITDRSQVRDGFVIDYFQTQ